MTVNWLQKLVALIVVVTKNGSSKNDTKFQKNNKNDSTDNKSINIFTVAHVHITTFQVGCGEVSICSGDAGYWMA